MKNRILNVVILTVIYCFTISAVPKLQISKGNNNYSTLSQEKIVLGFSAKLFCPSSPIESVDNNLDSLPISNFNNNNTVSFAIIKAYEQLFLIKLSQHITFLRNTLINKRKTDLFFPFHYFW